MPLQFEMFESSDLSDSNAPPKSDFKQNHDNIIYEKLNADISIALDEFKSFFFDEHGNKITCNLKGKSTVEGGDPCLREILKRLNIPQNGKNSKKSMLDAIYLKYGYSSGDASIESIKKEEKLIPEVKPEPKVEPKPSIPQSDIDKLDIKKLSVCSNEKRALIDKIRNGYMLLAQRPDLDFLLNLSMVELEQEREDVAVKVGALLKSGAEKAYTLTMFGAMVLESDSIFELTGLDFIGISQKFSLQKEEIVDIFKEYMKDNSTLRKLLSKEMRVALLFLGLPTIQVFENMNSQRVVLKKQPPPSCPPDLPPSAS